MQLSEKIAALRKQRGWSQEDLAAQMDVSRQSVSKWESGASVPELDRIVQLCDLFGISADSLIRPDSAPEEIPDLQKTPDGLRVLSLDDVYDYIAHCRTATEKLAFGVAACVASPAPLLMSIGLFGERFGCAVGIPLLLAIVAWAVYQFVLVTASMRRFAYIQKGRFVTAAGVRQWIRNSLEEFRITLVREISLGVVFCIVSPAPVIFLCSFWTGSGSASSLGTALLLAIAAAGVYLFVRSGCVRQCYRRLMR